MPLFEEDHLRISELARRARLSKQTMTTMVRLLERDGLVRRRPDPSDGRASLISLTPRGRGLEPIAREILGGLQDRADQRLGTKRVADARAALKELMEL